ncbi:hypothetical protein LWI29_005503 [Acer saccharum]|uniref:Uncharacterized protein n=1 Tax=Acer saccharum TaxID=4024 RepID=A0AA39VIB6_ACESA|nr:hypothetical protein LWI29_005503 [Acer saccharum]
MLLDVETLGGNLCGQVQRLPKSPVTTKVALEGLAEIVGLGDSSAVGVRGDGFAGIQSGFVGSGEGLYKVVVGLSSSTRLREEVAVGVDSLSGQIPVGRAEVEVGEVQIKGRWKRWAREAGVRNAESSEKELVIGKKGTAVNINSPILPPGNNKDAIPDDATARQIFPFDLKRERMVLYKYVFPVPPAPYTKYKPPFFSVTDCTMIS